MILKVELIHQIVQSFILQELSRQVKLNQVVNVQFDDNQIIWIEVLQYRVERIQYTIAIGTDAHIDPMKGSFQMFRYFIHNLVGVGRGDFVRVNAIEAHAKFAIEFREINDWVLLESVKGIREMRGKRTCPPE